MPRLACAARFDEYTRRRIQNARKWVHGIAAASLVVTPRSGHDIPWAEPDLVVWAVRRALYADPARRLSAAATRGGAAAVVESYRAIGRSYPEEMLHEYLSNTLGYELLHAGRIEDAIAVFDLNVEAYPEAWNPYDSLGEAYARWGKYELAIRNYERSLRLNAANEHAAQQLRQLRKCLQEGNTPCPGL